MGPRSKRISLSPEASWILESKTSSSDSGSDIEGESSTRKKFSTLNRSDKSPESRSPRLRDSKRDVVEPELIIPSLDDMSHVSMSHQTTPAASRQVRKRVNKRSVVSNTRSSRNATKSNYSEDRGGAFYMQMFWEEILYPILDFLRTVLSYIAIILKPFLAICLAIWILVFLSRQIISTTFSRALVPLCNIPGASSLGLPFCAAAEASGAAEFDQLVQVQSSFEEILSSTGSAVTLPADMKRSESSIRDLRHVVQFSALPSRNELVFEFGGFIDAARQASSDLTRFNSRIGRATDKIISTNKWTLQVIDGVAEREASRGSVSRMLQETIFYPFRSASLAEDFLLEQYLKHTRVIEEQISELIVEASTLLAVLENLDNRLDVIHGITTRDGVNLKGSRDELLSQLWTKLGGNRFTSQKYTEQIRLLERVSTYRKTAYDHVSVTLLKLQSIEAGLQDLRERVAAPELLGPRSDVPLKMHIEHIQLGLERLEMGRGEGRKLETEHQRTILDEKGSPGRLLSLPS